MTDGADTPRALRRLCIDARMLGDGGTGVSSYTRALLAAAGQTNSAVETLAASGRQTAIGRWLRARAVGPVRLVRDDTILAARDVFRLGQAHFNAGRGMLRLHAPGPPGIMHWTYPVPLTIVGWHNLYTAHDAIPETHPTLTRIDRHRHRRLMRAVAGAAARIVTVSDAARRDLIRSYALDPATVVDCGQAVLLPVPAPTLPHGLATGGYLLFCGQIEPRKNLGRLIAAYGASGIALPLVLCGPVSAGGGPIVAAARGMAGVRLLAYQDRATLAALIAGARALVLPSLAEGFGLPLAEAMTLGTPALISRDPALLEVAAGAALAVAADDQEALAGAISRLATDDALCAHLRERGRAQAHRFAVARFAARLEELYAGLA